MPAGDFRFHDFVVDAEAEDISQRVNTFLHRLEELEPRDIFATNDAVDINEADLDVIEIALLHDLTCVGGGADFLGPHRGTIACARRPHEAAMRGHRQ